MTTQGQIEILQAYVQGEEIEIRNRQGVWEPLTLKYPCDYNFNFQGYGYRIKKNHWRAEEGESYYYLSSRLSVEQTADEDYIIDRERYDAGNYFQTEEEALRAADHMKKSLKEFHNHD